MKNLALNIFLLVLFITLTAGIFLQVKAAGAVCPQGDIKYEVGASYEYTDSSATVTIINGEKNRTEWQVKDGYQIASVCIKIGGPGGGSLKNGLIDGGGPFAYDISHLVITTQPSSQPNPSPSPSPSPIPNHEKIIICHATGSEQNPYVEIEVDRDAWDEHSAGHSNHPNDFVKGDRATCGSQGTVNPIPSPTPSPTTTQTNNQSSSSSSPTSQSAEVLAAVSSLPATGANLPIKIAAEILMLAAGLVLRKLAK